MPVDEKEVQKKYIMLQLMKQQLNALAEQKNLINEKIAELAVSIDALKKLENVKEGQNIMATLGSNVFISADIHDTEKVLVNIGNGILARKSREDAIIFLQGNMEEIGNIDKELTSEINKYVAEIQKLEPELQKMVEQMQE
jgi:prefoldin alpha subunit